MAKRITDQNEVFYGLERDYIKPNLSPSKTQLISALNFFSNIDKKVKKKYAVAYAESMGIKGLNTVPDEYCGSLGALARMLQVGFMVDFDWPAKCKQLIIDRAILPKEKVVAVKSPNDPANVIDAWDFVDSQIDGITLGRPLIPARTMNLNRSQAAELRKYITNNISELSDDEHFKEC